MIDNRDMMYGGYYQGGPNGSMAYSNYGYQTPQGCPYGNMNMPNMPMMGMGVPFNNGMMDNSNTLIDFNARISNLENRINNLEKKINGTTNLYQDDNSMYML